MTDPEKTPIRILILDDRPEDAELMVHELQRSGFALEWERIDKEPALVDRLKSPPDVILSDYSMPLLVAERALEVATQVAPDTPFIVVSGVIGEEIAVSMMRQGAADYLLKDRLTRLGPAVRRVLDEKRLRVAKRAADNALRASEIRFASFMDNSPALAFIKDQDGRVLYINATFERVWKASLDEWKGKRDSDLWPPDVAAKLRLNDLAVLESGEPSRVIEDVASPDGCHRHLLSFRFPFADATGQRMLGGVSVDITEQMRIEKSLSEALAAKEVLLKEVHHRVKNNLQIISSLLSMQSDTLKNPDLTRAFRDSERRVQSMALIHERLYCHDDMERLDFSAYAEALIRDLFCCYGVNSDRVRLRLELEPVGLDLNQAIPCGLILNELVTNSLKYAFPDDRAGEILVAVYEDDAKLVTLRIADDGPGLAPGFDWRQSRSLGLRIVDILAQQLGGTIRQRPGQGADFSLVFRATALAR